MPDNPLGEPTPLPPAIEARLDEYVQNVQEFFDSQCTGYVNCRVPHEAWDAIVSALAAARSTPRPPSR